MPSPGIFGYDRGAPFVFLRIFLQTDRTIDSLPPPSNQRFSLKNVSWLLDSRKGVT